jgi:hypothetical protein
MQVAVFVGRPGVTIMCKYNEGAPLLFEKPDTCSVAPVNMIADAPPQAAIQICAAKNGSARDCTATCRP